jgi:uncharacterized protein YcfL
VVKVIRQYLPVIVGAFFVAGCDSDNDVQELRNRFAIASDNITSVSIDDAPEVIELLTPTSLTLTADQGAENFASLASWSSSDTNVATVSSSGIVSGIADGTATIQGVLGPHAAAANIRVSSAELTDIQITAPDQINECGSALFSAEGIFAADNNSVRDLDDWQWSVSSTPTIGVFSEVTNGLFRSSAAGTATITASRGTVSQVVTVTVNDNLQAISISPADPVVTTSSATQFSATAFYSDGAEQADITDNISWSVSNTSIASVDNTLPAKGSVTASSTGSVTLTAICATVDDTAAVQQQVEFSIGDPSVVISIEFQRGNSFNLEYNNNDREIQLNAIANLQDGSTVNINEDVEWTLVRRSTPLLSISNDSGSEGELLIRGVGRITVQVEYDGDRFDEDESTFNIEQITIDVL